MQAQGVCADDHAKCRERTLAESLDILIIFGAGAVDISSVGSSCGTARGIDDPYVQPFVVIGGPENRHRRYFVIGFMHAGRNRMSVRKSSQTVVSALLR